MQAIPELVDKVRAAALLGGVSVKTVDRLRASGDLQSCRVRAGSVRITVASIADYLERQLTTADEASAWIDPEPEKPFIIPALEAEQRSKAARHALEAGAA